MNAFKQKRVLYGGALRAQEEFFMPGKKPFGGYSVSFAGQDATLEHVFGSKPIPPSEMTKKLWAFVKSHNLSSK